MTDEECVAAGGHYPVWKGGGRFGHLAEHYGGCTSCPARRYGYFKYGDAEITWREWGAGPMRPAELFEQHILPEVGFPTAEA